MSSCGIVDERLHGDGHWQSDDLIGRQNSVVGVVKTVVVEIVVGFVGFFEVDTVEVGFEVGEVGFEVGAEVGFEVGAVGQN
jgi:hypothetical protein